MQNRRDVRRSPRRPQSRTGFTLVEIMIVVFIIAVLLNIAAPAFVGARDKAQARSCIKNLGDFVTAKEQYALENKIPASSTTPVAWSNLSGYLRTPSGTDPLLGPPCPTRGDHYVFGDLKTLPTCPYGTSSANPLAVHALVCANNMPCN